MTTEDTSTTADPTPPHTKRAEKGNSGAKKLKATVRTPTTGDGQDKRPTPTATAFAQRLKQAPPKSVAKALSVFKKFSLTKFPEKSAPSNYVPSGKNPAAAQRKLIEHQLQKLRKADTPNRGMMLVLPRATIKKLLPSFNAKTATANLSDVIKLITKNMRGTEFYAHGNPTLNRLALQSRVQEIMAAVKQPSKASVRKEVKK
jgi:hypothetical protein